MGSISAGELKGYLQNIPDDYEVIMNIHHKYDIPKEQGEKGWIAYINGIQKNDDYKEILLMN